MIDQATRDKFEPFIGEEVYHRSLYNLIRYTLVSVGKVNLKLTRTLWNNKIDTIYTKPENVALPDEEICVVWQRWKGIEGTYRIERELYPNFRIPTKMWPHQALVTEKDFHGSGVYDTHRLSSYLSENYLVKKTVK